MKIIVASFGYKFGTPNDANILIDARSLRNPFKMKHLRNLPGTSDQIFYYVTKDPNWNAWLDAAIAKIDQTLSLTPGMPQIAIGVGCHGGRHRSVVAALEIARVLHWKYAQGGQHHMIQIAHRDIGKGAKLGTILNVKQIAVELPKVRKKEFKT